MPGGLADDGTDHRLNPRFLILPWIKIPNLGSHILALIRRRLPDDWTERYSTAPVLVETFVDTPRYTGAVYKASGWIHVGGHQGARPIRPGQALRQAQEGHLAPAPAKRLETHPQSPKSTAPYRPNRTVTVTVRRLGDRRDDSRICAGNDSGHELPSSAWRFARILAQL